MAIERMSWSLIARLIDFDRRIEALDMADHQGHAGAAGGGDDGAALLHRRRDRLLDHDVDAARDAFEREVVMQMRRRGDGDRVDAGAEQAVDVGERGAAERARDKIPLLAIGIGDANEIDAGHVRQHARMVAAHDANADDPDLQRSARLPR